MSGIFLLRASARPLPDFPVQHGSLVHVWAKIHVMKLEDKLQWKVCLSVRFLKLTISWNPSRLRHITDSPKTEFSMFCPLISSASTGMVGLAFQLLQRLLRGGLLGGLSVTMRRFLGRNITGFWFSRILKQRKCYLFKNLQKFSRLETYLLT